ncbi:hypothetical protein [Micromonospora eburnea]|uniref:Alpha/beta hydrolase family protein n=1 Tax=Micromonospora eburnea TaxID=227316 RepID=A0A1C6UKR5_9ACTN|nr:hypothetical protein [Micromonospora eburnea]SCL54433.1 hypothetical protein GA0070604_2995 [Micromonospora eburnea]
MAVLRSASARLLALLALTTLPPVLEAALSTHFGLRSLVGLAPQASAPLPFAIFHDLRWISVYHHSWPQFAGELIATVLARGVWATAIVLVAWPSFAGRRPAAGRALLTGITGTAALTVFLLPWAALSVAISATSLSWLFIADVGVVFVLVLVAQRAGLVPDWWQGLPPPATVLWAVVSFLVLTVASVVLSAAPGPSPIVLAAVAGIVNGWLWRRLLSAALAARIRLVRVPVAPLVAVGLLLGIAPAGFLARTAVQAAEQPPPPLAIGPGGRPPQALIFVGGYDSVGDGTPTGGSPQVTDSIPFEMFSYAGLDAGGRPLPYRSQQTQQSLETSAKLLDAQVAEVHARTGKPVALLAESEGTLVVRTYLATRPHPAVVAVVLLSPVTNPSGAAFPPAGDGHGWGLATGAQLRAILTVASWSSGLPISIDEPLIRSLMGSPQRYRDQMFCPVPEVRTVAFVTLSDALTDRPGNPLGVPFVLVVAVHGDAFDRSRVQRELVAFLHGATPRTTGATLYRTVRAAAVAWQAPPLRISLFSSGPGGYETPRCRG